ncbi:hypothetical protein HELRODRAFT_159276 [Helobdella robusta]|uniref:Uncharacterized protein n=1 Tax=Helobdella robusta TaxID=6412 RepID=T1ENT4_HELRO|nr:hypothetical protein HELRODRAFT_159276 [Helobdella robusta]ESO12692.1 hypothetical protein HELRODRAFT_159276 [Helobdella robusta]
MYVQAVDRNQQQEISHYTGRGEPISTNVTNNNFMISLLPNYCRFNANRNIFLPRGKSFNSEMKKRFKCSSVNERHRTVCAATASITPNIYLRVCTCIQHFMLIHEWGRLVFITEKRIKLREN